jgi:hypothetical protein
LLHVSLSRHQLALLFTLLGNMVEPGPLRQKLMYLHLLSLSHLLRQSARSVALELEMAVSEQNLSDALFTW